MENLLFPSLNGSWKKDINLNKFAKVLLEDMDSNPLIDPNLFGEWINLLHKTYGVDYSFGGYMEDREEILDGTYLPKGGKVHLGVDYWVPQETAVHLPVEAKLVHSKIDPDQNGGWGGQAVFQLNSHLHIIFGHLKHIIADIGKTYPLGSVIGYVAEIERSGGWYPHLHVQCMRNMNVNVDGYAMPYFGLNKEYPDPIKNVEVELNLSCTVHDISDLCDVSIKEAYGYEEYGLEYKEKIYNSLQELIEVKKKLDR